jgi:hypothetical protein
MTKRDYEFLAGLIKEVGVLYGDERTRAVLTTRAAQRCALTNSNFNVRRFLDACGVKQETNP